MRLVHLNRPPNDRFLDQYFHQRIKNIPQQMLVWQFQEQLSCEVKVKHEDKYHDRLKYSVLVKKYPGWISRNIFEKLKFCIEIFPSQEIHLGMIWKYTGSSRCWSKMKKWNWMRRLQCESGFIESPLSEIIFLISLAWAKGSTDVGDPMLKIEKCCEGDRAPPTPQKSENKFRVIWLSMRKDSNCTKRN